MQRGEDPLVFLKRVFAEVISDLSDSSYERAKELFHPSYEQTVDDKHLDRDGFIKLMRVQKSLLAESPSFEWKKLVATKPRNGRIHVTSVHNVSARLQDNSSMQQRVVALIEIDVATGTIIQCDELTRMDSEAELVAPGASPPESAAAAPRCGPRPAPADRVAKHARSSRPTVKPSSRLAADPFFTMQAPFTTGPPSRPTRRAGRRAVTAAEPIVGVALRHSGVSDLLGDMCEDFGQGSSKQGKVNHEASTPLSPIPPSPPP